jgi:hypothetical protein
MKKLLSAILALLMILTTALMLTGCDQPTVSVESEMRISEDFHGSRTVTVKYPLSVDIDAIKDTIIADDPTPAVYGASFAYKGVEEDGYYFELTLAFGNRDEYEEEVSAIIGRTADVFFSRKDTVLTKGTRMAENFSSADLIAWITRATASADATKDVAFRYAENAVEIGSEVYTTEATTNINEVAGSVVNAISIKTSNGKDDRYDRTFVFSIPNQTYIASKDAFEQYFLTNTAPAAGYYGWTAEGTNMLYTVIYDQVSLSELSEYTAMLLDTDSVEIFYGDKDNASTPLSEGLAFEETLDTFSFIGPDNGAPALSYSYSLPTNTIHGDGTVFGDGKWKVAGAWEEGVYKLDLNTGSLKLRIPDGIQYAINGIDFTLESLGNEQFRRTTSFLYSKTDGHDGMSYAADFFAQKGAEVVTGEDEKNLYCTVTCEGDAAAITRSLVSWFGSGNFLSYRRTTGAFALSTKTAFVDYVNLGAILNSSNANRPMRYFITSSGEENIVTTAVDGVQNAYDSAAALTVTGGVATIEYSGNIPITANIVIYSLVGAALLILTILAAVLLLRRKKAPINPEAQRIIEESGADEDIAASAEGSAPMQTTTFSILELGALSRNKKYVEEINRDVEERMEADRLREQKEEIRRRELEEMGRKVYGSEDQAADPVAMLDDNAENVENGEVTDD